MSNKMQYLTRQKETFASSSKTYQYLILNVYGINGINLDLWFEFNKPVAKAYKSISITSQTLCR